MAYRAEIGIARCTSISTITNAPIERETLIQLRPSGSAHKALVSEPVPLENLFGIMREWPRARLPRANYDIAHIVDRDHRKLSEGSDAPLGGPSRSLLLAPSPVARGSLHWPAHSDRLFSLENSSSPADSACDSFGKLKDDPYAPNTLEWHQPLCRDLKIESAVLRESSPTAFGTARRTGSGLRITKAMPLGPTHSASLEIGEAYVGMPPIDLSQALDIVRNHCRHLFSRTNGRFPPAAAPAEYGDDYNLYLFATLPQSASL
jgi:hypothetical protein